MKYRIADEPSPGALERLIVHPVWPLLASMLAGPWVGWSWFLINGTALGSPNAKSDRRTVLIGLAGLFALVYLLTSVPVEPGNRLYWELARLVVAVWRLAVGYWLYDSQETSFELHEYYGGTVRNGLPILFAAILLRDWLSRGVAMAWWLKAALL